jgi:hypothetical protein
MTEAAPLRGRLGGVKKSNLQNDVYTSVIWETLSKQTQLSNFVILGTTPGRITVKVINHLGDGVMKVFPV